MDQDVANIDFCQISSLQKPQSLLRYHRHRRVNSLYTELVLRINSVPIDGSFA